VAKGSSFSQPQTMLIGGKVYTMADNVPREAILVEGNKIKAVGSVSFVESLASPGCKKIDISGCAVYPGFEDAHIHFSSYCATLVSINLVGTETLEEGLEVIRKFLEKNPETGEWITGAGWDKFVYGRMPTAADLDRVIPNKPAVLAAKDGHSIWVNSVAMKIAGIDKNTPAPPGGAIIKDEKGEPTGVFQDNASGLIRKFVPARDRNSRLKTIKLGFESLIKMGITAVQVPEGATTLSDLLLLREKGQLPIRVTMMLPLRNLDDLAKLGMRYGFGDSYLKLGQIKMFKDGSLGASTAYMMDPYEGDDAYVGLETTSQADLIDAVKKCVDLGFPIACHAIGDRACKETLDAIELVGSPPAGMHRIEHAQLLLPDDICRFAKLGVVASVQPGHASADRYMADAQWGPRARYAYAFGSLLKEKTCLAFGSDAPVEVPDPFLGIYSAVLRKRPSEPDSLPWYPEECMSVFDSIKAYTVETAKAVNDDGIRGTLTPGKLADLIITSRDLMTCDPEDIMETVVNGVMVDGQFLLAPPTC
jgi:predicted amidohydrolase YtcJ